MHSSDGFESENSDTSDKELQLALEKGLLSDKGLNLPVFAKRPPINNVVGLKSRLREFHKSLEWIERLDVTTDTKLTKQDKKEDNTPSTSNAILQEDDDFGREIAFYKQAQSAIKIALPRLQKLGEKTQRPKDYLAEMAKSDKQMTKVREKLLQVQRSKEKSEQAKRLREERKFASKVQFGVLHARQTEKKELKEAIVKHKKGSKESLQKVLGDKVPGKPKERNFPKKNTKKREYKDKKFGFGGQKKRGKYNTQQSTDDVSGFGRSAKRNSGQKGPKGGKKQKRPGKSSRKKLNAKKRMQ